MTPHTEPGQDTDLRRAAQALIDAAHAYWQEAQRAEAIRGAAVVWLEDSDGRIMIFTRGEYRGALLQGVERLRVPVYFDVDEGESDR